MPRAAHRFTLIGFLALTLLAAAPSGARATPTTTPETAATGEPGWLSGMLLDLKSGAERVIILGAALLYQNRHTFAGMTLGCAAGALAGAAGGLMASGDDLAGAAPAAAAGCAVGAGTGAHLGRPFDDPME
ncbi:hypothetical protein [Azospirillum sp.]|uniref:hypothetical protein n=1 Tax=Azospirillum sp. TaxID=34012 RepID=UPI002D72D7DB|nr:hypothetical protein [Azospirillum sp.]HYD67572.1 hypothetical protein [Azospirillum sp.]